MTLPSMGRVLVPGDAQLIAAAVRNKALVGGRGTQALRPILGEHSLIVLEGQRHRNHRRSIAPSLSADAASRVDKLTLKVCREMISKQPPGALFSVQTITRAISLRLIMRVLFDEMSEERERQLLSLVENLLGSFSQPVVLFINALHWNLARLSPWGRFVHNRASLRAFILQHINECKSKSKPDDALIDRLIVRQRSGEFDDSDEAIFEERMRLPLFRHDTAAGTMVWAFHHVHQDPASLQQLRDEAHEHAAPTAFFCACMKESQRSCPVVVHVTRVATTPTRLGDYELREGDSILPSMYLVQCDPINFPEPARFLPQRFLQQDRVPV